MAGRGGGGRAEVPLERSRAIQYVADTVALRCCKFMKLRTKAQPGVVAVAMLAMFDDDAVREEKFYRTALGGLPPS